MTSKAGRRRKKAGVSLPGEIAAEQSPRQPNGRIKAVDPQKVALDARCRVYGIQETPGERRASSNPLWGSSVERLILMLPSDQRPELANAARHAREVAERFRIAKGAPPRHARGATILAPVDAMHADASSPALDTRTPEERARQATSAQMRVEMWVGHCDSRAISAFKQAVINDPDGPVRDWPGVMNCLRCIAEGLKGETVKIRVRR